jgi:hypothetical protein
MSNERIMVSAHLSLDECTKSDTAKRRGINNTPPTKALNNLKLLAQKVFEPIRLHFGVPIYITSAYRSPELNKAIGGSSTSQHMYGEAMDIDMDGRGSKVTNADIFNYIKNNLVFDQLIWEFGTDSNPDWVHVSYESDGVQRKQILRAKKVNGKSTYTAWK